MFSSLLLLHTMDISDMPLYGIANVQKGYTVNELADIWYQL